MCGIVGVVDPRLAVDSIRQTLAAMTDAIVHRGPDDAGTAALSGMGIAMRRLSIIDVAGGHQPIANESGNIHVVCNGEIYNHRELRHRLIDRGHRFRSESDSEVIVHLYEDYGEDCFRQLRGMFAVAILDQQQQRVVIARDRLGKKPLFYAQRSDRFWFGSEMKSLIAAEPSLRQPDYTTLGQFFQFGYIRQPDTIYRNIARLPAGHYGVLERERFSIRRYWKVNFEPDDSISDGEWGERLDAALDESVRVRLESEVPLGVFLSGGLDSSAVVAYAHRAGLQPLRTFTVGFDRSDWDESRDAERVAKHFGSEHHVLRLSATELRDSFAETLQKIVSHCDEPFGDASAVPMYHISRLARQHVTVMLSGDGGDELFAGYSSYRGALFGQAYRRLLPDVLGRRIVPALPAAAAPLLPPRWRYRALRMAKVFRDSSLPLEQGYRSKTCTWNAHELQQLLVPEAFEAAAYVGEQYLPDDLWGRMKGRGDLVSRLTEIDIHSYLLDDILVKVDRMSMAHSLEVRSPLLDHSLVELAAKMPTRVKLRWFREKAILRDVLRRQLPRQTARKRKQGFSVPLRDWFRGPLSDLVHDVIGPRGWLPDSIFARPAVDILLDQHHRGAADHSDKIWLLMVFAVWHQQYQSGSDGLCGVADSSPARHSAITS